MKIKNTGIELFRRGSKGARNIKWILLQVFILTFCLQSQSQNNPIQFEQLTPGDGLSQGHILCMIQDSEGYIWAGTFYGLNRYNGYNFDVFYADKKDTNSMLIDMASSLCEDSDGNIWVGTWGISIFNKKTEKFRNFLPQESGGTVSYGGISAFAEDARKNMWIGTTGGGLDKYDYQTKKINRCFSLEFIFPAFAFPTPHAIIPHRITAMVSGAGRCRQTHRIHPTSACACSPACAPPGACISATSRACCRTG